MNQSLSEYLRDQGYTTGTLNERIKALLVSLSGGSSSSTIEELWLKLGTVGGYGSTIAQIQKTWSAEVAGMAGATWNDNFKGLPGLNLVSNGSFLIDTLGWVLGSGWTQVAGLAIKAAGSTSDLSQSSVIPVPGETYRVSYNLVVTAGTFMARIGNATGANRTTTGLYTDDITAVNSLPFSIRGGSTAIGTVTGITVRRL